MEGRLKRLIYSNFNSATLDLLLSSWVSIHTVLLGTDVEG